ncbi:activating transcription factor 7-interacting protein 2 isoform X1 [Anguilla rostrata]|uniref:activating transcription factor 7-interacting protein 2 isoform X1 n=1 Tax=Anguilla rostrata TaxID=7938 RepID=UPI0030D1DC93
MAYCCVPGCTSYQRRECDQGLSFHRFPSDPDTRRQWIAMIRRDVGPYFEITDNRRVCSKHFSKDCIERSLTGLNKLKKGTVPSLFTWCQPKARRAIQRIQSSKQVLEALCDHDYEGETLSVEEQLDAAQREIARLEEENQNLKRKASVDSDSPDFVPSVFGRTDQSPKSQTRLHSLQRKRKVDENTLPVEKRRDIRVVDDQPAVTKAPVSTPETALEVMNKRKIHDSNAILSRKPSNAPDTGERLLHPVKTFSKAEIQQLIKQEILASMQQSEHKMDELIKRIDSISRYEAVLIRLQADVKKIKRREQVALAYVRKLRPAEPAPPAPPAAHCQPLSSRDSPVCILDSSPPAEPPPAEPRATDSPASFSSSRISAEGDCAQSRDLSSLEASEMEGEVVFCGVRLPRKRIVEGFWQRRLKINRVVDLTEDAEMDAGSNSDPDKSQNGDPNKSQDQDSMETVEEEAAPVTVPGRATDTAHVQRPTPALGPPNSAPAPAPSSQDSPASAAPAATDSHTTSHAGAVTSCPPSDQMRPATADPPNSALCPAQDDWRSRLPPLPATPSPAEVPPSAAGSSPPQQVALTVARIKNPKGIGALWTLERPDPRAAPVSRYHIYALQEALDGRLSAWRSLGAVRAMPLPMACKLTDHGPGRRFCFAVLSEDVHGRFGPYSQVQSVGPQD